MSGTDQNGGTEQHSGTDQNPAAEQEFVGADPAEPQETAAPAGESTDPTATDEVAAEPETREQELARQLGERTDDLKRLQAEYVNYKRRVDRDRDLSRQAGVESVLRELLPTLDDLRSARQHEGELTGGFKAVATAIEKLAGHYHLVSFGEPGDAFDPQIHEALMHVPDDTVTGPTCVQILQPGYRLNDRVVRPARVAVAEPQ